VRRGRNCPRVRAVELNRRDTAAAAASAWPSDCMRRRRLIRAAIRLHVLDRIDDVRQTLYLPRDIKYSILTYGSALSFSHGGSDVRPTRPRKITNLRACIQKRNLERINP